MEVASNGNFLYKETYYIRKVEFVLSLESNEYVEIKHKS